MKKIIVVGDSGIGKSSEEFIKALEKAKEMGIELIQTPPKSFKEQMEESVPKEMIMTLTASKTLHETYVNLDEVEKLGVRGITNNRKLKKKRKKKGKKTHRKKKKK